MKRNVVIAVAVFISALLTGCKSSGTSEQADASSEGAATEAVGQSGVQDDVSNPNIVQVAVGSKDHSTLVTAVKAAGLVDALSNAGPFTVFAPTNAAFDKLPKGTVEGLLEPDKKDDLKGILEYHTYVGSLKAEYLQDGQSFEQVSGQKVTISKKDGKTFVNGTAEIVASIPTANGMIHVINEVLLPPAQ
ncbi:MAG: fasciclin domain-containing protein [Sphingobacteriales bacterium]|nr:fasciclin domain-containing protein [Sphingobacteriales bacterium]